jgi:hypothetical protein
MYFSISAGLVASRHHFSRESPLMKPVVALLACVLLASCASHKEMVPPAPAETATPQAAPAPEQAPAQPPVDSNVVPLTTVDTPPRLVSGSPPSYSLEMIQNHVEGIVKAMLLVGRSGGVKDVTILQDLGHGTGAATRQALMSYHFEPAMKGGRAVAVWLEMSVNFRPVKR